MVYLTDIFNVSHFAVTVTANDILRIEIKRSSTSVRVGFTYKYATSHVELKWRLPTEL
jgi:hypothetical protein